MTFRAIRGGFYVIGEKDKHGLTMYYPLFAINYPSWTIINSTIFKFQDTWHDQKIVYGLSSSIPYQESKHNGCMNPNQNSLIIPVPQRLGIQPNHWS